MKYLVAILLLFPFAAVGQVSIPPGVINVASAPTGACTQGVAGQKDNTGAISTCQGPFVAGVGTWAFDTTATSTVVYLTPSGDTTGVADQAAIVAALATGKPIQIVQGSFYFTGNIAISSAPAITCAGPAKTFLFLTSATNNFFSINYGGGTLPPNTTISQGGSIYGCTLTHASGVTPTAGYAFLISGVSGASYLSGLRIENNEVLGLCGGFSIGSFVYIDWFVNNFILISTACSGTHGIFLNDPSPAGDLHFDGDELGGTAADVLIHQSDVNEFTNLKVNQAGIVFDNSADRVRFINPSLEGAGSGGSTPVCGINFTGAAANILDVSVTGGAIDLMPHAFCANGAGTLNVGANATRFSYNTTIYSTLDGITGNISSPNFLALNGAALSGHCLVGNGTTYADSSICGAGTLATASIPAYSPVAGGYTTTQNVTITCAQGAPYYSTDGITVTAYSTPVAIAAPSTLSSGCYGFGYNPSTYSGFYVIGSFQTFDAFAGTVGTTLASHTDNLGHSWTLWTFNTSAGTTSQLNGSGASIATNVTASKNASYMNGVVPSSADYTVSGTFTVVSTATYQTWVWARASAGALTGYALICGSFGNCQISKFLAGVQTALGSTYVIPWTGAGQTHTIALKTAGTTLTAYIDGVSQTPVTDATISAVGEAGFTQSANSNTLLSNFSVQ